MRSKDHPRFVANAIARERERRCMHVCCLCGKMLPEGPHLCTAEVVSLLKDAALV